MKILIVEDDYITAQIMQEILSGYGNCEIAEDGKVAINKISLQLDNNDPYDIIFLDIMMPELSGQDVLTHIRSIESERGISGLDCAKVIMTTALDDFDNIKLSFVNQAEGYIVKPIDREKIKRTLIDLMVIEE